MEELSVTEPYPKKLKEHILPLSTEKANFLIAAAEWKFLREEDTGQTNASCPCGKTHIRYLCHISNASTNAETKVGNECINWFDDKLVEVVEILRKTTFNGTFHGYDKYERPNFQLNGNMNLVKKRETLQGYFGYIPIWKAGKIWLLATQKSNQAENLQIDSDYTLTVLFRVSHNEKKTLVIEIRNLVLKV